MGLSANIADWYHDLSPGAIPEDVIQGTRLRILDTVGVMLAAAATPFGETIRRAALGLACGATQSRIIGYGDLVSAPAAALANGTLSAALDFDDTHVQTLIHAGGPTLATALALAPSHRVDGPGLLVAIAGAGEIMCRLGMVAPGAWQRQGFHPTAITGAFGAALVAARLMGLDASSMRNALGIVGSQSAGIMESWVDGATVRYAHAGWAAQAGIAAAWLARAGVTGPSEVFEGRSGLFATHLPNAPQGIARSRLVDGLGSHWESRNISLKPYPAAQVIHPFVDAVLYLQRHDGLAAADVGRIVCRVAGYMVPLVCEPQGEKRRPTNDSSARVSLAYTVAEALVHGRLDADAYAADSLRDQAILALADKVDYEIDEPGPGRERVQSRVTVDTRDGRRLERAEEFNRGSPERPLSDSQVRRKFEVNVSPRIGPAGAAYVASMVERLDTLDDVARLLDACCGEPASEMFSQGLR